MAEETTARDRLRRELRHGHPHLTVEHADRLIDDYARELAAEIRQRAQFLAEDPDIEMLHGRGYTDGMCEGADTIDYPVLNADDGQSDFASTIGW